MVDRFTCDMQKYGIIFEKIIRNGLMGDTSNTSMVPCSFSRVSDTEVMSAQMRIIITPIIPGTVLNEFYIDGLKSNLTWGEINNAFSSSLESSFAYSEIKLEAYVVNMDAVLGSEPSAISCI